VVIFTTIHEGSFKKTQGSGAIGTATGDNVAVFVEFVIAAVQDGLSDHLLCPLYPGFGAGIGNAQLFG
jgi:hypothetical protein